VSEQFLYGTLAYKRPFNATNVLSNSNYKECMTNLGEITNEMASIIISQCKNIEDKWLDVII